MTVPFLFVPSQHPSHLGNFLGDIMMWLVNDHIYFLGKCFYTVTNHYTKLSCICIHLHPPRDSSLKNTEESVVVTPIVKRSSGLCSGSSGPWLVRPLSPPLIHWEQSPIRNFSLSLGDAKEEMAFLI